MHERFADLLSAWELRVGTNILRLPPLTHGRKRATAAYTERLQAVSPRRKTSPPRDGWDGIDGWQDSQRGFAVVSSLQALAISLGRLNSKPSTCRILQHGELEFGDPEAEAFRAPPMQPFSYAKQLERSALAYGLIQPKEKEESGCRQESQEVL